MAVMPLPNPANSSHGTAGTSDGNYWLRIAAGGSLVAGGLLLLGGKYRAGLLASIAGAALAMVDQQETVRVWWNELPGLIDDADRMLGQVQGVMENLDAQREKLKTLISVKS